MNIFEILQPQLQSIDLDLVYDALSNSVDKADYNETHDDIVTELNNIAAVCTNMFNQLETHLQTLADTVNNDPSRTLPVFECSIDGDIWVFNYANGVLVELQVGPPSQLIGNATPNQFTHDAESFLNSINEGARELHIELGALVFYLKEAVKYQHVPVGDERVTQNFIDSIVRYLAACQQVVNPELYTQITHMCLLDSKQHYSANQIAQAVNSAYA